MAVAKAYLTCTQCGKEFVWRHACPNRKAADSYERWADSNVSLCPECSAKEYREEKAARLAADIEALPVELPDNLVGSEKQIVWAKDIRAKYAVSIYKKYEDSIPDNLIFFYNKVLGMIISENTSAKWWIDSRNKLNSPDGYEIYVSRMRRWLDEYKASDPRGYAHLMKIANSEGGESQ